jgi:hypothetical protein
VVDASNALSELHARLLGPQAEQARLEALQSLQVTRTRLQGQARQGFPAPRYSELEAAMAAVQAGIDILERLSVGAGVAGANGFR